MNKQNFLQIQTLELQHLLESAGNDPILAPQLRERLEDAQRQLEETRQGEGMQLPKEHIDLPRTAIFLRGQSVQDSEGIRPSLAGEAMIQYEKMFIEQALHDEREEARQAGRHRRRRGSATPALLFTGTPRGSFGLEFTPQLTDQSSVGVHAQSLRKVSDALVLVAESDLKAFDGLVEKIPTRVLNHLKSFMGTLANHGAEIRLAYSDRPSHWLSAEKVRTAAALLAKDFAQATVAVSGTFRGLTMESGRFDLKADSGEVIAGAVADDLAEEDLVRISSFTNHQCKATLEKTTVSTFTGAATTTYVLIDAQPEPARAIS